jgi:hypothetical protein
LMPRNCFERSRQLSEATETTAYNI